MKNLLRAFVVLFLLAGLVVGIGGSLLAQKPVYTVYVVVHGGIGDPYWKKVENGVKDAAALYPDLKVIYTGPDVYHFEQFMGILEGAIAARPDGLLATMTNPPAMDELLRGAIAEGLPVIAIDSPDSRPPLDRIPYLSYVGELPYEGGVLGAMEALKTFRPKRTMYGNHHPGALNIQERGQGFIDVMADAGIPSEAIDITADAVRAAEIQLAYIRAHPDTDLIFGANVLRAETLVTRLEEEGIKPGVDVKIITFGVTPTTLDMIEDGKIMFSIDEQPYLQGWLGVSFMYLHLKYGFTPPSEIPTLGLFPKETIGSLRELIEKGIR